MTNSRTNQIYSKMKSLTCSVRHGFCTSTLRQVTNGDLFSPQPIQRGDLLILLERAGTPVLLG